VGLQDELSSLREDLVAKEADLLKFKKESSEVEEIKKKKNE